MGGNRIYGKIPKSIGRLKSLTLLNLSYNAVPGEIPVEIGQLEEPLLSIDLSNNRLNGSIPKEILSLGSSSTILNLSNNFLDGQLPQDVERLENGVTIDLSNNRLSGDIPCSFQNYESLQKLLMANNMLSCPIPNTTGEVKGNSPTHESFNGEVNIVKWVEATFPDKVQQVLDHKLQHITPKIPQDCLITIIGVGLSCTTQSPDCRISIRDALHNLKSAKHVLLKQLPIQQNKY
ncbi:hypothetical protein QYF36_006017 [Acer negundo]|nr:hypothetical protein QYF36_006017 [Acer negundo]